ncbi:MAG: GGDEF domain-containing protein [Sphingobium sp.]
MGEKFAFFLPVMMASFSCAFLMVWRWGAPGAKWWSAGYGSAALGFAAPLADAMLPSSFWAYFADIAFASGFLFFGQALVARWRPGWLLRTRVAIWAASVTLSWIGVARSDLPLELVVSDFGCFLLIALSLVAARGKLHTPADRLLFLAAMLPALDNLGRGSTISMTLNGTGLYASEYGFLMQALACLFGLFMALAALAACVGDMVSGYRDDALLDPLTGLLNRRGFDARVAAMGERAANACVILCDIDHFKAVNDMHGHAEGDRVIVALAGALRTLAPADAVTARFGGEEFVILLPGASITRSVALANRMRSYFSDEAGPQLHLGRVLTASFGVSDRRPSDGTIHAAIDRADLSLYEAKRQGRDRVCVQRAHDNANRPDAVYMPLARTA